jgi:hypothetical protein
MRLLPIDMAVGKLLNFAVADDMQKHQLGTRTSVVSSDYSTTAGVGNAGGGEAIYVKAAGTFAVGRLVHWDKDWNVLDVPNTANTGRSFAVCLSAFSAASPYGWILISGCAPVSYAVAATVGPLFVGAAGQATPTAAAGKQILGASCVVAASGSFTKSIRTVNGSPYITVTGSDVAGVYPGMAVSGTGIPVSTTVASIDNDGRTIKMSANATAGGAVTGTFTHTGFGIVQLERPFVQGQIT